MQMNLLYGMLKYLYQNPDSFITESIMRFSLTFNTIIVIAQIVLCSGKFKLRNYPKQKC